MDAASFLREFVVQAEVKDGNLAVQPRPEHLDKELDFTAPGDTTAKS